MATQYNIGDLVEARIHDLPDYARGLPHYFRARVIATDEITVTVQFVDQDVGRVTEIVPLDHVRAVGRDQRVEALINGLNFSAEDKRRYIQSLHNEEIDLDSLGYMAAQDLVDAGIAADHAAAIIARVSTGVAPQANVPVPAAPAPAAPAPQSQKDEDHAALIATVSWENLYASRGVDGVTRHSDCLLTRRKYSELAEGHEQDLVHELRDYEEGGGDLDAIREHIDDAASARVWDMFLNHYKCFLRTGDDADDAAIDALADRVAASAV